MAKSITRFLDPDGGAWTLHELWKEIGIDSVLEGLARDHGKRTPVERALFAMVANRALAPSSKLRVETWLKEDVAVPGVQEIHVQQLYRAMDFLLEAEEQIQREVFYSVAHLFNLEVDLLYFDTTSTYFEIEDADEDEASPSDNGKRSSTIRKRGHSKDHRPDLPQVVIGLAVTREGIPIRCWVWPGKSADMSVIEQVKKDLVGWKLGRVISVVDRGFTSEDNLRTLQRAGGHYIAGERMRSGKAEVEDALSRRGRYQEVRNSLYIKEIVVGDGEARKRYVLVRNPEQAKRDRAQREKHLARLEKELAQLKHLDRGKHTKAVCALRSHPIYGRYLRETKKGLLRIDRAKVRDEERLDGKYLLRTSDDTLTAADVALGYKQLVEIEAAFRTLKTTLDLRPVYHRLDDRIRAHVVLCWLALLLIRVAELRADKPWPQIRDTLQRMHLDEFILGNASVHQRTETTKERAAILAAMRVSEPPMFLNIDLSP